MMFQEVVFTTRTVDKMIGILEQRFRKGLFFCCRLVMVEEAFPFYARFVRATAGQCLVISGNPNSITTIVGEGVCK